MKKFLLGKTGPEVPAIAIGCMRMHKLREKEAADYLIACVKNGLNFFDHADIYGSGKSESIFAEAALRAGIPRQELLIQSKCGIVRGTMYDHSKAHILSSVDGILSRLKTDYLDVLLLHRPDALSEPEEVSEAFDLLYQSGKVRYFGVSNHNPAQMQLMMKYCKQPLLVNQLQLSLAHTPMIDTGLHVNMHDAQAPVRDGGVLDFCRLHDITIQPWSPFQFGFFDGVFIGSSKYKPLNKVLARLAAGYGVTPTGIALAWLLRHPAHFQPVIGTTKIKRMEECAAAAEITLSREEWYELYLAAGNTLP